MSGPQSRLSPAPRRGDWRQFARLARFMLPYRARIAGALLALVIAAACVLALGQGLKHVVDNGFGSGDPRLLDEALGAMIAVAAVLAVATYFRFFLMMTTGERVITDLRRAVFDHILALEPGFFEATRTGEVISRLTTDTTLLQQVIGFGLSMFVRNLLMMTGAAVMLFVVSWKLALMVLLGVPATLVPILLLGRRVRRLSRDNQDRVADVSAYVDEAIHEIRTVQAYAHEDADRANFAGHAEAAYGAGVARIRQKALLISSVMLIAFSAVGLILWIGGYDVLAGRLTAGELSAFVFYALVVAGGAGTVSEVWGELQRGAARPAEHDGHGELAAGHVQHLRRRVGHGVDGQQREVPRHEFDHRPQAHHGGAHAHAGEAQLGNGRVDHAPLAERLLRLELEHVAAARFGNFEALLQPGCQLAAAERERSHCLTIPMTASA